MPRTICLVIMLLVSARTGSAQLAPELSLAEVLRLASGQRAEIAAARAAVHAGEQRPQIVSALDDPMVSFSLDHVPFMGGGADVNGTIEQRVPLSSVRAQRRSAALADLRRLRADLNRSELDVQLDATRAFLMLYERRSMAALLAVQTSVARQIVAAADARYASGTAPQADVLRGEVELARLQAATRGVASDVRAAEAMLNASIGRDPEQPIPALVPPSFGDLPSTPVAIAAAHAARPELVAGQAAVDRAAADVEVMRAMTKPMLSIRTGPAYTMAERGGWMAMVGVSLPIWRGKLRAGIAEADAMRAMSAADLRAMNRMVQGETAAARDTADAAIVRVEAYRRDVLPRIRMTVESTTAAYAAGQVPLVSVIDSVLTQWRTELELIDLETQYGLARARLARAMGSYEGLVQ